MNSDVFLVETLPDYPAFPYDSEDHLKASLQTIFSMWGKDPENPFKEWLVPGARVVIKPNWVYHTSPNQKNLDALVTHTSLIKHLIDSVAIGLKGEGSIVVGDAPIQSCDFQALGKRTRIFEVVDQARKTYPRLNLAVEDWRLTIVDGSDIQKHSSDYERRVAEEYRIVDLGSGSFLEDISDYAERFRVTCYDPRLMSSHHAKGKHEYLVTGKVFDADLMINLPKMKTHIKAGLTGALKNVVGINGHKEYLPHHILGSSESGGDCYATGDTIRDLYDSAYDRFWMRYSNLSQLGRRAGLFMLAGLWRASRLTTGDDTSAGSWDGNETVWRMTLDLNHILYFGNYTPKKIISIVDGIVAGEGEGPLNPSPRRIGILALGENPAYVDAVLAKLMGYNISRIPTVYHSIYHRKSRFAGSYLENYRVTLRREEGANSVSFFNLPNFEFVKPQHWKRASWAVVEATSGAAETQVGSVHQ